MQSILITGVPGVGKTTLGRVLSERMGIPFIEYSEIMLSVISQADKDAIRYLSFDERLPIYAQVEGLLHTLFNMDDGSLSLLSTHLTILLDQQIRAFPISHYQAYGMAGIVVVEALPQVVLARREADRSRARHLETQVLVSTQQQENRRIATWVSESLQVPVLYVDNSFGHGSVEMVSTWLQALTSRGDPPASTSPGCVPENLANS